MAMEPARPREIELYQFPRQLRKHFTAEQGEVLIRAQLAALIEELRLSHAYKMRNRIMEMHIELGERIADRIDHTQNPLVRDALKRTWQNWVDQAEAIIRGV